MTMNLPQLPTQRSDFIALPFRVNLSTHSIESVPQSDAFTQTQEYFPPVRHTLSNVAPYSQDPNEFAILLYFHHNLVFSKDLFVEFPYAFLTPSRTSLYDRLFTAITRHPNFSVSALKQPTKDELHQMFSQTLLYQPKNALNNLPCFAFFYGSLSFSSFSMNSAFLGRLTLAKYWTLAPIPPASPYVLLNVLTDEQPFNQSSPTNAFSSTPSTITTLTIRFARHFMFPSHSDTNASLSQFIIKDQIFNSSYEDINYGKIIATHILHSTLYAALYDKHSTFPFGNSLLNTTYKVAPLWKHAYHHEYYFEVLFSYSYFQRYVQTSTFKSKATNSDGTTRLPLLPNEIWEQIARHAIRMIGNCTCHTSPRIDHYSSDSILFIAPAIFTPKHPQWAFTKLYGILRIPTHTINSPRTNLLDTPIPTLLTASVLHLSHWILPTAFPRSQTRAQMSLDDRLISMRSLLRLTTLHKPPGYKCKYLSHTGTNTPQVVPL